MNYKMYIISKDDELRVGKLLSQHLGRNYLGIAALRTFMPIRHEDEESKLLFILFPEDFCLNFLKEHLILHVEVLHDEPKTQQLEKIYNTLLSKICSYVYEIPNTKRNKRLICAVLSDHLCTYSTHVNKDYLIEDLESQAPLDDSPILIKSTVFFEIFSYLGKVAHISNTSSCWHFDPVLWEKQFGET
jgi:hypothetical protein